MSNPYEGARVVELGSEERAGRPAIGQRLGIQARGDCRDAEPTLVDYFWTLSENRFLVGAVAFGSVALAALYVFLAAPTYRSDVLLQVEDKTKGIAGLDDIASMFSERTPADTEIEILRSRSLLGSVVDELNLTVEARPRTFPVVGGALYRRYGEDGIASPAIGLRNFAWGGERIAAARLQVPEDLLDERLNLVAGDAGRFTLNGPNGENLAAGEVGKPATAGAGDDRVEIFLAELHARPGTQFVVMKRRRAGVIDDLQTELRISEKGKKTGILTVALDGKDAKKTASILDSIAQTYVRQNVERKSAEAAKTLEFLQEQLPILKRNVDTTEAAFKEYQLRKGSVDLTTETQAILERAVDLEKAISELDLNRAELRQRFTESHPMLVSLKEKQARLRSERAVLEAKMKGLPQQELESVRLSRDVKVSSELYFLLVNKAQELQVAKSGTIGNVRILDMALKPYEPVSPKTAVVFALALLLGLAAGIAIAFVRKAMDQGVTDPAEIEAATGVSVYASVPHSDREAELTRKRSKPAAGPTVLALDDSSDLAVESLRSLRTALQFTLADAKNSIVTVCGPSPAIGKSFLSVNLAHVLAMAGKRVLLIDGDLRRGHLHRYLGEKRAPGMTDVISGQCQLADATRKTALEHLAFVPTGTVPPNPSELLASRRFGAFLSDVSARYDLVLIDTPPILAVTDGALIARHAGVKLLALRAGLHPIREIELAVKQFAEAGVTLNGAVLNAVSIAFGRYGRYAYHYQYKYASDFEGEGAPS